MSKVMIGAEISDQGNEEDTTRLAENFDLKKLIE